MSLADQIATKHLTREGIDPLIPLSTQRIIFRLRLDSIVSEQTVSQVVATEDDIGMWKMLEHVLILPTIPQLIGPTQREIDRKLQGSTGNPTQCVMVVDGDSGSYVVLWSEEEQP